MRPKPGESYQFPKSPRLIVEAVNENNRTGRVEVLARYDWWGITIWGSLEDWNADRKDAEPEGGMFCIINCGRPAQLDPKENQLCPGPKCERHL